MWQGDHYRSPPQCEQNRGHEPSFARAEGSRTSLINKGDYSGLSIPVGEKVLLTVTTGPSKGMVYQFAKPRFTVGRKGADMAIDDPEISLHHCLIEAKGTMLGLRDLDSTNGTFYDEERTRAAFLMDGTESASVSNQLSALLNLKA